MEGSNFEHQFDGGTTENLRLTPCSICGRKFSEDALIRHEKICTKTSQNSKHRKPFDMSKQRLAGTELEKYQSSTTVSGASKKPPSSSPSSKSSNWREQHEQFIQSIRNAREVTAAIKKGEAPPPYVKSAPNPNYLQCKHCTRYFEPTTAERHIPFCKERKARIARENAANAKALEALNKRVNYRPPSLKKRSAPPFDRHTSDARPIGSSLVKQNTNFSKTYSTLASIEDTNGYPRTSSTPKETERKATHLNRTHTKKPPPPQQKNNSPRKPDMPWNPAATSKVKQQWPVDGKTPTTNSNNTYQGKYSNGIHASPRHHKAVPQEKKPPAASRRLFDKVEDIDHLIEGSGGEAQEDGLKSLRIKDTGDVHIGYMDMLKPELKQPLTKKQYGGMVAPSVEPAYSTAPHSKKPTTTMLNDHGLPMAKFCYECGSKFPVPQAKYCCECGTKRI